MKGGRDWDGTLWHLTQPLLLHYCNSITSTFESLSQYNGLHYTFDPIQPDRCTDAVTSVLGYTHHLYTLTEVTSTMMRFGPKTRSNFIQLLRY